MVKGASGLICQERLSKSLKTTDPKTDRTYHCSFVISSRCPTNLLGRDLMAMVGISEVPTERGMRAVRTEEVHVKCGQGPINYFYSLDLVTSGPASVTDTLRAKVEEVDLPTVEKQSPDRMHCTMYFDIAQVQTRHMKTDF